VSILHSHLMATKRESSLQRRIQEALRSAFPGCFVLKFHVSEFSAAGTPDLICCIGGYFIAIEVKVPGETPTELQLYTLKSIADAGGVALVVHSPQQAIALVEDLLAMRPKLPERPLWATQVYTFKE